MFVEVRKERKKEIILGVCLLSDLIVQQVSVTLMYNVRRKIKWLVASKWIINDTLAFSQEILDVKFSYFHSVPINYKGN